MATHSTSPESSVRAACLFHTLKTALICSQCRSISKKNFISRPREGVEFAGDAIGLCVQNLRMANVSKTKSTRRHFGQITLFQQVIVLAESLVTIFSPVSGSNTTDIILSQNSDSELLVAKSSAEAKTANEFVAEPLFLKSPCKESVA